MNDSFPQLNFKVKLLGKITQLTMHSITKTVLIILTYIYHKKNNHIYESIFFLLCDNFFWQYCIVDSKLKPFKFILFLANFTEGKIIYMISYTNSPNSKIRMDSPLLLWKWFIWINLTWRKEINTCRFRAKEM